MKAFLAKEVDCVDEERTQAKVQNPIDETLVDVLPVGNSDANNESRAKKCDLWKRLQQKQ